MPDSPHSRRGRAVPYDRWLLTLTELFVAYAEARRRVPRDPRAVEQARRAWRDHEDTWVDGRRPHG